AGARAFLSKPLSAARLLDTLAEVAATGKAVAAAPAVRPDLAPVGDGALDGAVLDELAQLGMGEAFEREFIDQCLRDAAESIDALQQSADAGHWDAVRDHAHALK